jgi:hypothetical protein
MDALNAASLCALFFVPSQAGSPCAPPSQISSPQIERWQPLISEAAHRFNIPKDWIAAVMRLESGGLTVFDGKPITSSAGAMGLMQLMPATYADLRARYGLGVDPYDPHDNVMAGAAYLHEMFVRYGHPNLFAAYHAGPGRLDAFLAGLKPLPEATQNYLNSLISGTQIALPASTNPGSKPLKTTPDPLFFVRVEHQESSSGASDSAPEIAKSNTADDQNHRENAIESNATAANAVNELFVPIN